MSCAYVWGRGREREATDERPGRKTLAGVWSALSMAPKRSSLGAMRRQPAPRHLYTSPILIQTDDGRLFDSSIKFNHITGLQDNPFLVTKSRSKPYIMMALAISAFAYMIFSESLGFKSLIMADQQPKFQIPHVENNVTTAASSKPPDAVPEESVDDALGPDDDELAYSPDYDDESSGDTAEPKSGDKTEIEDAPSAGIQTEIARDKSSEDEENYDASMAPETDDERTDNGGNETELVTQKFEDDALATDDESDEGEAMETQPLSSRRNATGLDIKVQNSEDEGEVN